MWMPSGICCSVKFAMRKHIAIHSDDSASEEDCFSSTEDYTMVNQNTWTIVDEDSWVKTQSICTCVAIGCTGYKDDVLQKALGHFGQPCKQVGQMAAEIATWDNVQIAYVGGWNQDALPIVAQFEKHMGVALANAEVVMSHVSPFNLPVDRSAAGFDLGLTLDVEYFQGACELSFSSATWILVGRDYPHLDWDLATVYADYAEGLIGEAPIDLFLNGRPSQAAFETELEGLNPLESALVERFYCLAQGLHEKPLFATQYQVFLDEPLAKKAKR